MISQERLNQLLFPYNKVRNIQDDLIEEVDKCLQLRKNLIVHAPTGLGKTAATIAPALSHALKNGLTVFFLTSRHTQHKIAIDTLKDIKQKNGIDIVTVDLIGKKWMCAIPGADGLYSSEFYDFCRGMVKDSKCEFYANARTKSGRETPKAVNAVEKLKVISPCHCEDMISHSIDRTLCPYEIAALMAEKASVVIADYYYIFNPSIRDAFLKRINKSLGECIVIVDEGHNLPRRARELLTENLSSFSIRNALKEARKFGHEETALFLQGIRDIFDNYAKEFVQKGQTQLGEKSFFSSENERLITKDEFVSKIKLLGDYEEIITNLDFAGEDIRDKQKKSYVGGNCPFFGGMAWAG